MSDKQKIENVIIQLETYLESWKQFKTFIELARAKKFSPEDEAQFMEVKSAVAQQLEMILAAFEQPVVDRNEIHALLSDASSIRNLSEKTENALRNDENKWNKIYITLQAAVGQLKAQQKQLEGKSFWSGLFGGKK
ncbi:MAG: hypothetical protein WCO56_04855 [Verrucomicrobiota bacterium]